MKKLLSILLLLCLFAGGASAQSAAIRQILNEKSGEYFFSGEIEALLEKGIDTQGPYKRTPLILAAKNRYTDLAVALVEAGANPDIQDAFGYTALMCAIVSEEEGPDMEMANALIRAGANVKLKNNDGETALHYAAYYHEPELVELLIDKGAELDVVNEWGETPLDRASNQGDETIIGILTQAGAGTVNHLAGIEHIASEKLLKTLREKPFTTDVRTIVELLEKGVDAQDGEGKTPLFHVIDDPNGAIVLSGSPKDGAEDTQLTLIRELIAMKADVNLADHAGTTPLIAAVTSRKPAIVEALVAAKADVAKGDDEGRTPLMQAVFSRNPGFIDLFVRVGADIEAKDIYGRTALHLAVSNEHLEMARRILENGGNADAKDENGDTPLMHVLSGFNRMPEMIGLLLAYKADANIRNSRGETVLMQAASLGETEIVKLLLEHHADVTVTDNRGRTAIMQAKSEEIKAMLKEATAE